MEGLREIAGLFIFRSFSKISGVFRCIEPAIKPIPIGQFRFIALESPLQEGKQAYERE
jgi:hypothetical protein